MQHFKFAILRIVVVCCLSFIGILAAAQSDSPQPQSSTVTPPAAAAPNADALRKAAQNPIASLISVPVQNNFNFNINPGQRTQYVERVS